MKIVLLEPFFTGSHERWAKGFQKHSRHEVEILSLPGRHWKWRMHGGAISLAHKYEALPNPDLILATDMLDLSTFLGLIRHLPKVPVALYFHENQLTYPWSPTDQDVALKRDNHYAWFNYTSTLVADKVFFNSSYHKRSFLDALPAFLKQFPDRHGAADLEVLKQKCSVLSLGMDLPEYKVKAPKARKVILWNHRWEYDKNPELFFKALFQLAAEGVDFGLIVTGEGYKNSPAIFAEAKERLADRIIHFGFVDSKQVYLDLLLTADLLPVTSIQDFFGGSVVEALAAGSIPLLPERLAYPEHLPAELAKKYLYQNEAELISKMRLLITAPYPTADITRIQEKVMCYHWSSIITSYDDALEEIISK